VSITIRLYQQADARDIAALYSRYPDNPNPVPGGISAEHVEQELAERRTAAFFVAVDNGNVVGTFGLFRNTGRRAARAGELIADMFFVAPAYRNGMLTGRLFTEAIEWMVEREMSENLAMTDGGVHYEPLAPRVVAICVVGRIVEGFGGNARGGAVARLVDALIAGSGGNLAGVAASVEDGGWVFRPEAPRRT